MPVVAVRAKKAEIRRRYRRGGKARTAPQMAALRLNDLARLFRARYGITLPDDDAGREDLHTALCHIAPLANSRARMVAYIQIWAPWITMKEAKTFMDQALTEPQAWTADVLAWRLQLTATDRAALGITTIGAVDLSRSARIQLRKEKARERERARRATRKAACAP